MSLSPPLDGEALLRPLVEGDVSEYEVHGLDEFEPDEVVQPEIDTLEAGGSWVVRTKYGRLDILQHVDPDLDYERLALEAIEAEVFGLPVRFCSYGHLVAMKEAAGRGQDHVDLQRLREIRGELEPDSD